MKVFAIILLISLSIAAIGVGFAFNFFTPETPDEPSTHEHAFGEWETKTPASCTAEGEEVRKCNGCDEEETRPIEKLGHTFGEWETKTAASCTAAGESVRACTCGAEETKTIEKLDHSFTKEVVDEKYLATANCEEQATYFKSCDCGAKGTETFAYGEVIAHDYGEWQTKTAANCNDAEIEYRACSCGKEETKTGDVAALGHNMVAMSDDTHHWTKCNRDGCDEATEKVAHSAISITAVCNKADAMKYDVLTAEDFTVTATCECEVNYTVTEGITLENATLAVEGENTVTVKLGELNTTVTVNAAKFNKVVSGTIVDDTYVASGDSSTNLYYDRDELPLYNTEAYRTLLRFNFSKVLASEYYADYKDDAIVKFTFTVTNGVDMAELPITFKAFPVSEVRSSANFNSMSWSNYNSEYTLGWGEANNPVNLLASETIGNRAIYENGKLIITVTFREIENCIDSKGNAIFIMLTNQKEVKPKIASMENKEFDIPAVEVIFSENHVHVYNNQIAEEKYKASDATCTAKATYYVSCACGEAGDETFKYGETLDHSYGEWETLSAATCTDAEVEIRKCGGCDKEETRDGDAALDHNMETKFNETNHWTECSRCDEATNPIAHFGGEATETEQATCEGCGQKYGGLASHVHQFGEWQTESAATCTTAEVEFRKCECGFKETQTGDAALNHNMETKYDDDNHWTECSRCDNATEAVAHSGGEATIFERAICETCGQHYGELAKILVDDTYVDSTSGNTTKDRSETTELRAYAQSTSWRRTYFRLDISDLISMNNESAKLKFTFTLNDSSAAIAEDTKFTLYTFNVTDAATRDVDFGKLNWNSVKSTANNGTYPELAFNGAPIIMDGLTTASDSVAYDDTAKTVTLTINYSAIEDYIDASTGYLFIGLSTNVNLRIHSLEATDVANRPTVEYIYN